MTLTPAQIAERLRDSGHHEAALQVALDALADGAPTPPGAANGTTDPPEEAPAPRTPGSPLEPAELLRMDRGELEALRRNDPAAFATSMASLVRGSR